MATTGAPLFAFDYCFDLCLQCCEKFYGCAATTYVDGQFFIFLPLGEKKDGIRAGPNPAIAEPVFQLVDRKGLVVVQQYRIRSDKILEPHARMADRCANRFALSRQLLIALRINIFIFHGGIGIIEKHVRRT